MLEHLSHLLGTTVLSFLVIFPCVGTLWLVWESIERLVSIYANPALANSRVFGYLGAIIPILLVHVGALEQRWNLATAIFYGLHWATFGYILGVGLAIMVAFA